MSQCTTRHQGLQCLLEAGHVGGHDTGFSPITEETLRRLRGLQSDAVVEFVVHGWEALSRFDASMLVTAHDHIEAAQIFMRTYPFNPRFWEPHLLKIEHLDRSQLKIFEVKSHRYVRGRRRTLHLRWLHRRPALELGQLSTDSTDGAVSRPTATGTRINYRTRRASADEAPHGGLWINERDDLPHEDPYLLTCKPIATVDGERMLMDCGGWLVFKKK